ncbi:MAG: hypothetical protein K6U02_12355 [Firmicutes bacterium]|nr:hypothetical protein [Bacillota bacterium]
MDEPGHEAWQPISRPAYVGWLVFFGLFLLHAATDEDGYLLLDHVNLIIHEAGHLFFSGFGFTMGIFGGTLAQLLVPALLVLHFVRQRHLSGTAFAAFWFFENFFYVGWYMADARSQALPLVGSGEHDWEILFGQWGLLVHDRTIGGLTRLLGWFGLLAVVAWFAWAARRHLRTKPVWLE